MSYTVSVEKRESYLLITFAGELTLDTEEQTDRDVVRLCNEHNVFTVLVDARQMAGPLTMTEVFQSASTLSERGFDARHRCAFVSEPGFDALNTFYETVAANRGAKLRTFEDIVEAEAWLLSE